MALSDYEIKNGKMLVKGELLDSFYIQACFPGLAFFQAEVLELQQKGIKNIKLETGRHSTYASLAWVI